MAGQGISRQELIRRRRASGFVGRQGELNAFKDALKQPSQEAMQFLFHIHGPAGVGKSTLVRELERAARDAQAVTAYVDESIADVVEALGSVSAQFAQQDVGLKTFDKLLSIYRQRRHEASISADPAPGDTAPGAQAEPSPSPSSVIVTQLGLVGLGLIPGVGAFTGAVDRNQVAAGADRIKAVLAARFRNHEDVQLVLDPLPALTAALLQGLADVARHRKWVVLFFDTYERTGPLLDTWLRDLLVSDRYGELPSNVMVVLAGQNKLDVRCWGDWLDLVTQLPLDVFTEGEARQLLLAKGISDERITEMILQLSGRLPVLVSTLAQASPTSVEEIGDPSGTAVERFLKWELDPARRAVALVCSLPQELDEDVFRAAVQDENAGELFGWIRSLPFVTDRSGRCLYHDVVRAKMLRLQRQQSPARWQTQHTHLADTFRERRDRLENASAPAAGWWMDEQWRGHRLRETYHRLCASPRTALPDALRETLDACDQNTTSVRRWAQTLVEAGRDTDYAAVLDMGQQILTALDDPAPRVATLTVLLSSGGLDSPGRGLAYALRGDAHRIADRYESALADYTAALALEPDSARSLRGRGSTYHRMDRHEEALTDLNRAIELSPDNAWDFMDRGSTFLRLDRHDEALADLTRAIELDPKFSLAATSRGDIYFLMGRHDEALADLTHAIDLDPASAWAITSRGDALRRMGRCDEALADLTRAIEIDRSSIWAVSNRSEVYRLMGRHDEAVADLTRAIELDRSPHIVSLRGKLHCSMGRYEEALRDQVHALELDPDFFWALVGRGDVHRLIGRNDESMADFTRALELDPGAAFALTNRGVTFRLMGRYDEALTDLTRALELDPGAGWAHYEKAVALHALQNPERDTHLARAAELFASSPTGLKTADTASKGNLFLTRCAMLSWDEAEVDLADFLSNRPPRGQIAELLTAVDTLVHVIPSAEPDVLPFRHQLEDALSEADPCATATGDGPGGQCGQIGRRPPDRSTARALAARLR